MKICDKGHDEIVYTEKKCPLCAALKEIEHLQSELDDYRIQAEEKY
jgi:phage FluMu protein Com